MATQARWQGAMVRDILRMRLQQVRSENHFVHQTRHHGVSMLVTKHASTEKAIQNCRVPTSASRVPSKGSTSEKKNKSQEKNVKMSRLHSPQSRRGRPQTDATSPSPPFDSTPLSRRCVAHPLLPYRDGGVCLTLALALRSGKIKQIHFCKFSTALFRHHLPFPSPFTQQDVRGAQGEVPRRRCQADGVHPPRQRGASWCEATTVPTAPQSPSQTHF
jgi:hypothetical protein